MLKALGSLFTLLLLLAIAGAVGGYFWFQDAVSKPGPLGEDTVFEVSPGETLIRVAGRAEAGGLIADNRLLRLQARLHDQETAIKTGEFSVPAGVSISGFLDLLVAGDVIQYTITIPEGLTTAQIARRIEADDRLLGDLPDPLPAEGVLLPETYAFTRGTSKVELFNRMAEAQDVIILASVVQKEASGQDEYGKVASVFVNRLNEPMPLQSDPTVIYGVSQGEPLFNRRGERRTLYRSELDTDHPWNTYTRPGLPETPIANPGRGAIEGVLNPPETPYFYFVATGRGGHAFARSLDEHNANVADYRAFERAEIARERAN